MIIFSAIIMSIISFLHHSDAFKLNYLPSVITRRDTIKKIIGDGLATTILSWTTGVVSPSLSRISSAEAAVTTSTVTAASLMENIPRMEFDAPATNLTVPSTLANCIEEMASSLENAYSKRRDYVESSQLSGSWRLLYSNGPEITSLAARLPFGFTLGPTYQPLDTNTKQFENRGSVLNRYGIAKLQTNVIGDISVSPLNSLNAVGIRNDRNNRVNVDFRCIVFQLDEIFGKPISFRKTLIPKLDPNVEAQPANDITYLDDSLRIIRGGDGAMFIFERAKVDNMNNKPMLTFTERDNLFGGRRTDNAVIVGGKKEFLEGQPELNFLFQKYK